MESRAARRRARLLRPAGFDELGLNRAISDRMLPILVGAMAFLAALALAGAVGAASLAQHWRAGAGSALTVQVPRPRTPVSGKLQPVSTGPDKAGGENTAVTKIVALLRGTPGIASARALSDDELADLLRPWLGANVERLALPLPDVIEVRLAGGRDGPEPDLAALGARLNSAVPGTLVEGHGVWVARLSILSRSLQACAGAALLLVAGVAAAVIAIATRAGLSSRRDAIEIVHGLGATDAYIAGKFAARATLLAGIGAVAGALAALPVLIWLATLAAPFIGLSPKPAEAFDATPGDLGDPLAALPLPLWIGLPALPVAAAGIGFATAQGTVRRWLRRLP